MKKFLKSLIFCQPITTALGTLSGGPVLVQGLQTGDKTNIVIGVGLILLGLFSKDGVNTQKSTEVKSL